MLASLIAEYGYLAVFVGAFLEGETILVLGGIAAHRGYLRLDVVMLSAFLGSLFGDQLYFSAKRSYGSHRKFNSTRPYCSQPLSWPDWVHGSLAGYA